MNNIIEGLGGGGSTLPRSATVSTYHGKFSIVLLSEQRLQPILPAMFIQIYLITKRTIVTAHICHPKCLE